MNGPKEIITRLADEGSGPAAIAEALNARGMSQRNRMPFTEESVESFMRLFGLGLAAQEVMVDAADLEIAAGPETPDTGVSKSLAAPPIVSTQLAKSPGMLKPWPMHTDFCHHNLDVKD